MRSSRDREHLRCCLVLITAAARKPWAVGFEFFEIVNLKRKGKT